MEKKKLRRQYFDFKWCNDCRHEKPIKDFSERSGKQKGMHLAYCKVCMNDRQTQWRITNKKRYNLYQLEYRKVHPYIKKDEK